MESGSTENLKKPQNCQNWGVGACLGQYGMCQRIQLGVNRTILSIRKDPMLSIVSHSERLYESTATDTNICAAQTGAHDNYMYMYV